MKKTTLFLFALLIAFIANAQTADEVLDQYFENIGGLENLKKIEGIKMSAKTMGQGMEIPIEIVKLKDGKQYLKFTLQGKEIMQMVFDGNTMWSTNFMTMKAEKSPKEDTDNMKLETNDFPGPFIDYKDKGYTVELLGKETIDGAETYKIKLVTEPVTIDGKEEESVSYYYFDTENYVPIVVQTEIKSGPMKGQMSESKMSDYQEVDGIYFPFSLSQGLKGQPGQTLTTTKIELNPQIDDAVFVFPETEATAEDK